MACLPTTVRLLGNNRVEKLQTVREALEARGAEAFLLGENTAPKTGNNVLERAQVLADQLIERDIQPGAQVLIRFSEPMDPLTASPYENLQFFRAEANEMKYGLVDPAVEAIKAA